MSAEVLKFVSTDGTEHTLNHTNTNINDTTTSGVNAWSSAKTSQEISSAKTELQDNIDTETTERENADSVISGNLTTHTNNKSNPHSVTKAQVGLGSVENTALSTWAGSSNLTTCNKGTFGDACTKGVTDAYRNFDSSLVPTALALSNGLQKSLLKVATFTNTTVATITSSEWTTIYDSTASSGNWTKTEDIEIEWSTNDSFFVVGASSHYYDEEINVTDIHSLDADVFVSTEYEPAKILVRVKSKINTIYTNQIQLAIHDRF